MRYLECAADQHNDQERHECECETDRCTLRPRCTAHDFRAASDADARALGNLRIAVWADEFFHAENIAARYISWEHFSRSVCRNDADARNHRSVSRRQRLVSLRRGAHPLHGKVLERQQQFAEVAPDNFDFVIGKLKAQGFAVVRANKRCGDEMLERKDVEFAAGRFEAQARGRGFTLPARWGGWGGWFVGFRAMFHGVVGFVV